MPLWSRRELLAGLLVAAVSGCVPARTVRTPAPAAALEVQRLSPRTLLITGAGGNVLATRSTEGLILIDGSLAEQREALLATLEREFPATPIAWLFNTHWHRDQTGLNEWVGQHGGVICAHENTRLWLATEFYVDWQDRTYEPLPQAALPNRTFYGTPEHAQIGDRLVAFGRLPNAHTDGDIFVHLIDEDVLAVGGAVTATGYPLMDYSTGGWLGGVVDASRVLMNQAGSATRVVASDGAVLGRAALETQLALATTMRERISAQMKLGKSVNDMLAEGLTKDFDARYGDPKFFVRSSYRGLWGHSRELGIV